MLIHLTPHFKSRGLGALAADKLTCGYAGTQITPGLYPTRVTRRSSFSKMPDCNKRIVDIFKMRVEAHFGLSTGASGEITQLRPVGVI